MNITPDELRAEAERVSDVMVNALPDEGEVHVLVLLMATSAMTMAAIDMMAATAPLPRPIQRLRDILADIRENVLSAADAVYADERKH